MICPFRWNKYAGFAGYANTPVNTVGDVTTWRNQYGASSPEASPTVGPMFIIMNRHSFPSAVKGSSLGGSASDNIINVTSLEVTYPTSYL